MAHLVTGHAGMTLTRAAGSLFLSNPTASDYIRGALCGLAAVSIWAGWIVAARLSLRSSLNPWDITAIRFGVAGLILLPYLLRKGLALDRLTWVGLVAIVLGGGAPMVLVANSGLLWFLATFDDHAASRNLRSSRSRPARPYIWRLRLFKRLICPSTGPLLQANIKAGRTAS